MFRNLKHSAKFRLCFVSLILFLGLVGCMSRAKIYRPVAPGSAMYTFGDANYERQLKEGKPPIKHGPIAISDVPDHFPVKFLDPDGSYAGGRIYKTISEAQRAVLEAKRTGMISESGEWGIYQLEGNWDEYAYEPRPGEWHLNKSTLVAKRVY